MGVGQERSRCVLPPLYRGGMTQQIRRVGQHAVLYAMIRQELLGEWLQERLGDAGFQLDLRERVCAFSSDRGRITARAELVASIAVEPATLLWAWTPRMAERVGPPDAVTRMREFGAAHGLHEFTDDEVPHGRDGEDDEVRVARIIALGHDTGQAAIEALGAGYRYYSFPSNAAGTRGVVVLDDWSDAPPEPTTVDVFTKLPRLVPEVDDLGWSLEGLARLMPGWSCERLADAGPGRPVWRLVDGDGRRFDVAAEFDERNRLVAVRLDGLHDAA